MGELCCFAVCKNQSFDSSGVEIVRVPAELCGPALNLNPDNLKRPCVFGDQALLPWKERQTCAFLDGSFYPLLPVVVQSSAAAGPACPRPRPAEA